MFAGSGIRVTGAASTVVRDNLTKDVVLISDDKGKIASSSKSINQLQDVITGAATTVTDYDLTPNKVVISDADGKINTSSVSNIEVDYLVGTHGSIQNQLDSKANQSTTYTKTEVNDRLLLKANQSTTYTKTEVDDKLMLKANQSTTYTKTEVDNSLLLKADQSTTYTKTEVDDSLALKASQATTYSKTEVDTQLANLIGTAPDALNTLNELAAALNDDANYAATIESQLASKQNLLNNGSDITMNVGRGDVYFENNHHDDKDGIGSGLTLRTSQNPITGSIFAVRSSGQPARLWVGHSFTTTGSNDFYCGYDGGVGSENDTTRYRHSLNNSAVTFGTPVTCSSDLTVNGPVTCSSDLTVNGSVTCSSDLTVNGSVTCNVGRGDVYFENNSYDEDGIGSGLTLRPSQNPSTGSIFAIRSSGQSCRLWVGQNITTTGANDFYCGYYGGVGSENDTSGYKHSLNYSAVTFGAPVTCSSDLTVNGSLIGGLTANGGSGGNVLNALVGDGKVANIYGVSPISVTTLLDFSGSNPDNGNLRISLDTDAILFCVGRINADGTIKTSKGRVGFTCSKVATGNYLISFATDHPDGADYVISLTPKRSTDDIECVYEVTSSTGFDVKVHHHDDGGGSGNAFDNEFCFFVY